MSKRKRYSDADVADAHRCLLEYLANPKAKIFITLRSCRDTAYSQTRKFSLFVTNGDGDLISISYLVARVLDEPLKEDAFGHQCVPIEGGGMDMAFAMVDNLGRALGLDNANGISSLANRYSTI